MWVRKEIVSVKNWIPARIAGLDSPCLDCTSHAPDKDGYPQMNINSERKKMSLHRFLYIQEHGELPSHILVRHKCDNRKCINLDHLETGTHADNMRDKARRRLSSQSYS